MDRLEYALGDTAEMKKPHPCGSRNWTIIRVGADIKLKCQGCDHIVMIPRSKFNKMVKKILPAGEKKGE
jgi:hypothetical protein